MPITSRYSWFIAAVLGACALQGCAGFADSPRVDARFGEAVMQSRALQTLRPEAAGKAGPAGGLDAESARNAIVLYQGSFKAPPQTFGVLGLGGLSMGGQ